MSNRITLTRLSLARLFRAQFFEETQVNLFVFLNWAKPGLFFIYFRLFKHTLQFLQQINVKKCPSSIRCRDLNSQPLYHESPLISTRPGSRPTN